MRETYYEYVSRYDAILPLLAGEGLLGNEDGYSDSDDSEDDFELVERWEITPETADAIEQGSQLINPQAMALGYWEFATLGDCQAWLRSSGSQRLP